MTRVRIAWARLGAATLMGALGLSLLGPIPQVVADEPPGSPAPDAPPAAVADLVSVVSGQSVTVSPLVNDVDPEGLPLQLVPGSVAVVSGSGTATPSANDVLIATTAGYVGPMVVAYAVADPAGNTASSTITADVTAPPPPPNVPPVAAADTGSMYAPAELRIDLLANDSDPDGDALAVTGITMLTPQAGTVALEGQVLVIRSTAGYAGPLSATYVLADARGGQAQGTVEVTVVGPVPNGAPVAAPDAVSVRTGGTVRVKVLANDSDPDGDQLRLAKVGKPRKGKARRAGSTLVYTAPKSTGTVRISYTVTDARGASATGTLTVTITARKAATPKPSSPTSKNPTRRAVESALARLGLPVGAADGRYDARTRRAVCAWRTVMGRSAHRGLPTGSEARAIVAAQGLPSASATMVTGVTVSVTCQAAFWVGADREYRRVMPACTGKKGFRTRLGTHRVFVAHSTWRYSTIYPEARMYKPMQFSGGQAMHGSATDALVHTYPASHGCVRMLHRDIDAMIAGGVGVGTLVRVIGRW